MSTILLKWSLMHCSIFSNFAGFLKQLGPLICIWKLLFYDLKSHCFVIKQILLHVKCFLLCILPISKEISIIFSKIKFLSIHMILNVTLGEYKYWAKPNSWRIGHTRNSIKKKPYLLTYTYYRKYTKIAHVKWKGFSWILATQMHK